MNYKIEWEGSLVPLHYNSTLNKRDCETRKIEMTSNFNHDMDFFYEFRGGRHEDLEALSKIGPDDNTTPIYSSLGYQLNDYIINRIEKAISDEDFHNGLAIDGTIIEPHFKILVDSQLCSFYDLPSDAQLTIAKTYLEEGSFRGKFDYEGKIDIPEKPIPDNRGFEYEGQDLEVSYNIEFVFKENSRGKKSESEYKYSIDSSKMTYEEFNNMPDYSFSLDCLSKARKEEIKNIFRDAKAFFYSPKSDLEPSGEIQVYDSDSKIIHWDDLSDTVKNSILDKVLEQDYHNGEIYFTLELPKVIDLYDIAVTDIAPDKLDPDFLTGVIWIGDKDYDFDYCKSTGDIYFHNYDYSSPTYSGYKELELPDAFEDSEMLEIFEDEVDIACTAYLHKELSLDERIASVEAKAAKSSVKESKSKDEMEL